MKDFFFLKLKGREKEKKELHISICGLEQQVQNWGKSAVPETWEEEPSAVPPLSWIGEEGTVNFQGSTPTHFTTCREWSGDTALLWSPTGHRHYHRCLDDKVLGRVTLGSRLSTHFTSIFYRTPTFKEMKELWLYLPPLIMFLSL